MKSYFSYIFNNIEEYLIVTLITLMLFTTTIQVIGRLIGNPPMWTEEFTRFCLTYFLFIGMSVGIKKAKHVGVYIFASKLPKALKYIVIFLLLIIMGTFLFLMVWLGAQITLKAYTFRMRGSFLPIPMWVLYLIMPFSGLLGLIRLYQSIKEKDWLELIVNYNKKEDSLINND